MRTINPITPSFGSSHDPVLHGVANGLADLFPPVDHPEGWADGLRDEPDATAGSSPASEDAGEAEV